MRIAGLVVYLEDYITEHRKVKNGVSKEDVREILLSYDFYNKLINLEGIDEVTELNLGKYHKCIDTITYKALVAQNNNFLGAVKLKSAAIESLLKFEMQVYTLTLPLITDSIYINEIKRRIEKGDLSELDVEEFTETVKGKPKVVKDKYLNHVLGKSLNSMKSNAKIIYNFIESHFDGDEKSYEAWMKRDLLLFIKPVLFEGIEGDSRYNYIAIKDYLVPEFYYYLADFLQKRSSKDEFIGAIQIEGDAGLFTVISWLFDVYFNQLRRYFKSVTTAETPAVMNQCIATALNLHEGDYCLFSLCPAKDVFNCASNYHKTCDRLKDGVITSIPSIDYNIDSSSFFLGNIIKINTWGINDGSITIAFYNNSYDESQVPVTTSYVSIPIKKLIPRVNVGVLPTLRFKRENLDNIRSKIRSAKKPKALQYIEYLINYLDDMPMIIPAQNSMVFEHCYSDLHLPELLDRSQIINLNYEVILDSTFRNENFMAEDCRSRENAIFKAYLLYNDKYKENTDYFEFVKHVTYCESTAVSLTM